MVPPITSHVMGFLDLFSRDFQDFVDSVYNQPDNRFLGIDDR